MSAGNQGLMVRRLGLVDYLPVWQHMQEFTLSRGRQTVDELWLLQHPPVFTQGQAGKQEHVLAAGDIPVVQVDRGGQVTYHGPGQLVAYLMLDIRRRRLGIRKLVNSVEAALVAVLDDLGVVAAARPDAPGVYVAGAKIAALGFRVRRGCTYHGLAFNIDVELEPFSRINPCGYTGLAVTRLKDLLPPERMPDLSGIEQKLAQALAQGLEYELL